MQETPHTDATQFMAMDRINRSLHPSAKSRTPINFKFLKFSRMLTLDISDFGVEMKKCSNFPFLPFIFQVTSLSLHNVIISGLITRWRVATLGASSGRQSSLGSV